MGAHEESIGSAINDATQLVQHVATQDNVNPRRCVTHVHE